MKKIWITWERHRRTRELAQLIPELTLFEIELEANSLIRYPYLLTRTFLLLIRIRPVLVITQNPSAILTLFCLVLKGIFGFRLIADAHNEGLIPFNSRLNILRPIYHLIQKHADMTIVTNQSLAALVEKNEGKPFVLEDKIPDLNHRCNPLPLKGRQNVVFVCTFEKDEPYWEVIRAARLIDSSVMIYVTGKYDKASPHIIYNAPPNVSFTGFLRDRDYVNLFYSCDLAMDLTLMEDCLVCGAYEAVGMSKPVILTDTKALKRYFYKGTVFTANNSEEIAKSICYGLANKQHLSKEISLLKDELIIDWKKKFDYLMSELNKMGKPSRGK